MRAPLRGALFVSMKIDLALYEAFSEQPVGGSQTAIIADASAIPAKQRPGIVRELEGAVSAV